MNHKRAVTILSLGLLAGSWALQAEATSQEPSRDPARQGATGVSAQGKKAPKSVAPGKGAESAGKAKEPARVELGVKGLRFGLSSEAIAALYDREFTAQFLPLYRKVSVGPRTRELDRELEEKKAELRRRTLFNDLPMGLDSSPLRFEFTYGNKESLTKVRLTKTLVDPETKAKREIKYLRHFFFFSDRMWKIYDEYRLGEKGPYADFKDAVKVLSAEYGGKPRLEKADESAGRGYQSASWTVGDTVVQLLNRDSEKRLAVVLIKKAVFDKVDQYRPNTAEEEGLSPEVQQATSRPAPKPAPVKKSAK